MKLKVKDTRGRIFKISDAETATQPAQGTAAFSDDEIIKLKMLVPYLDTLLASLKVEAAEHDDDLDEEQIDKVTKTVEEDVDDACSTQVDDDEDAPISEENDPEVIHDSKTSFGATEKNRVVDSVNSEIDRDAEIANAWAKRYNGGK